MSLEKQIKDILKFSDLMGNEVGDQSKIDLYVDLLNEEFNAQSEFRQSLRAGDKIGVRDGLADIFVVGVQLAYIGGGEDIAESIEELSVRENKGSEYDICVKAMFDHLAEILNLNSSDSIFDLSEDAIYLLAGVNIYADKYDINLAEDLGAVMKSNFSKFCVTDSQLSTSLIKWDNHGVKAEGRETGDSDYPYSIHAAEDSKKYPKGKLLKPVGFKEPLFL